MSIFFLYGQEDFLIDSKVKELKNRFINKGYESMTYFVLDNPDFADLEQCLLRSPIMFGNIVSVIDCDRYFFDTQFKTNFDDKEMKAIEDCLDSVCENHYVIFRCRIEKFGQKKIDTRKKIFKILSKRAKVEHFELFRSYDKDLLMCISNIAKKRGVSIDTKACKLLIERCSTSLRVLDNEIEKLILMVYPNKRISEKDVLQNSNYNDDVFLFIDTFIEKNKDKMFSELSKMYEKKHPLELIGLINSTLNNLIFIKLNEGKMSIFDISKSLGMHQYRVKLFSDKIKSQSVRSLIELKKLFTLCEYKIKTGQLSDFQALELVLLR